MGQSLIEFDPPEEGQEGRPLIDFEVPALIDPAGLGQIGPGNLRKSDGPVVSPHYEAISQVQAVGREERIKAMLENPDFADPGIVADNTNYIQSVDLVASSLMIPPANPGPLGQMWEGFTDTALYIAEHPIETGKALVEGLWTAMIVPMKLSVWGIPVSDEELEEAGEIWKFIGTSTLAGIGGGIVGGPVGAIMGITLAPAIVLGEKEETFYDIGRDAAAMGLFIGGLKVGGAVLRPVVSKAVGKGLQRAGRSERVKKLVESVTDDVDDLAVSGELVENLNRTVNDTRRPRVYDDIDMKGYNLQSEGRGAHSVLNAEGKVMARGIYSAEELSTALERLPSISKASPSTDMIPFVDEIHPGQAANLIGNLEHFGVKEVPWAANAKSRFEALDRILSNALDRPVNLTGKYLVPFQQRLVRFFTKMKADSRDLTAIADAMEVAYKDLSPAERAARMQNFNGWIQALSADEIIAGGLRTGGRGLWPEEIAVARRIAGLAEAEGSSLKEVYNFMMEYSRRVEKIPKAERTLGALDEIKVDIWDSKGFSNVQKEIADLYLWVRNHAVEEMDMYNVTSLVEALVNKAPNRGQFAARAGMSGNDIRIAQMIDNVFNKVGVRRFGEDAPLIRGYISHVRKYGGGDVTDIVQQVARNPKHREVVGAINDMKRAGYEWNFEADAFQNLVDYVRHVNFADEVGNIWHNGVKAARDLINEADSRTFTAKRAGLETPEGILKGSKLVRSIDEFWNDARGIPTYDAVTLTNEINRLFRGTKLNNFWKDAGSDIANMFIALHATGLLGWRPGLAFRDLIDAWGTYAAQVGWKRSSAAFKRMTREVVANRQGYNNTVNVLKGKGYITEHTAIHEIASFSARSPNPVMKVLTKWTQNWSASGERWGLQPLAFEFNQATIFTDTYNRVAGLLKKLRKGDINEAQFARESGMLYQQDGEIARLTQLMRNGSDDLLAEQMANLNTLDIMGRYGYGFGPMGRSYGWRAFMNFRNYPATRRASISRMLSRGTPKQRRQTLVRLMAYESSIRGLSKVFGFRSAKYSPFIASISYTGGPLLSSWNDIMDAIQFKGGVSGQLGRFSRQFVPYYAVRDVLEVFEQKE